MFESQIIQKLTRLAEITIAHIYGDGRFVGEMTNHEAFTTNDRQRTTNKKQLTTDNEQQTSL